jgi:hypothetical protein
MNKVTFYFIVSIATLFLFSCSKNDPAAEIEPPRAYADQYKTDIADIEEYLNTYYITVVNNPGKTDDQDVTMTKIPVGGTQLSIMSYKDNVFVGSTVYPQLRSRVVKLHDVDYKLYYLVLRPGIGESPSNVDGVFTSYRGDYLSRDASNQALSATKFTDVIFPQSFDNLTERIIGWGETFPQFKKGTFTTNADGSVSYNDFGAGVMFLPSGLAYYNNGKGSIPSYSPLVFSFKLYEIQRLDQDNDGVPSFQEEFNTIVGDGNKDGYMHDYRNTLAYPTPPADAVLYADDTDKDGIPDFLDIDDDGDNYTTKLEITKPAGTNSGLSAYFPYDPILDNPLTTVIETETKGIPRNFTGPLFNPSLPESSTNMRTPEASDYTDPLRLRRHLDPNCKPPYQN